jgi:hypothetical protein
VLALLHTNRMLREEVRNVYLKLARKSMASCEAAYEGLLPMFVDGNSARNRMMKISGGPWQGIGYAPNSVQDLEFARICISWYVLNNTCEVLEGHHGRGGSALARWRRRQCNKIRSARDSIPGASTSTTTAGSS